MNKMPPGHVHIAPAHQLVPDETQAQLVLVHPQGQTRLTPDQGRILKRCNGASTAEQIADDMARESPALDPEETRGFLAVAYANNWIHGQ